MPRVHYVKKARKDYPEAGIKKGEPYYYATFRFGGKRRYKTRPRPSQLTSSDFLGTIYAIQEEIEDLSVDDFEDDGNIESWVEEKVDEIRNLGEEQSDKRDNMPDQLQDAPTGEMLGNRADSCEDMANELEGVDASVDISRDDYDTDEEHEEAVKARIQEIIEELQGISYEGE